MNISIVNLTHGLISDQELQTVIRALNRQVQEDFSPYWNLSGQLRLEGYSGGEPRRGENTEDMRGDAVIYIWDEADIPNALGYHAANHQGIPFGFVFIDISREMGENWTVTFSHEVLELLGDRQANLLVQGPHPDPANRDKLVYHWREMCDAVQADTYEIDGVQVSNFVLPLYFTPDAEAGGRNDFLGRRSDGGNLESFGINPGGYVGFYNPETGKHESLMGPMLAHPVIEPLHDTVVGPAFRQRRKNKARDARRGNRYQQTDTPCSIVEHSQKSPYRAKSGNHTLKIGGGNINMAINRRPVALDDSRNKTGRFAHNIYASGKTVQRHLEEEQLNELQRLAFEVDAIEAEGTEGSAELKLEVTHNKGEVLFALTEIDGILLWYACDNPQAKTRSTFTVPVAAATKAERARRGNLFSKARKTLVRFFKHRIRKSIAKKIRNNLSEYLAETVEEKVFNKKRPLVMQEFVTLPKPENKMLARIQDLQDDLEEDKRYLLFVHGIFSSISGAFGDLLLSRGDDDFIKQLQYDRIIGANHWTVAHSTLENATSLLKKLPAKCDIDIVCHSRGAGVVRCLLEHADLKADLDDKQINFRKVIFVAGACQGSPLAHPSKIGSLVNTFSVLSSLSTAYFPLKLVTGLLKAVEYAVKEFPGIAAMSPESPIIARLNEALNYADCEYVYMRSDYEPGGTLKRLLDEGLLDRFVFEDQGNDLVVPFEGAGTFDEGVNSTITVTPSTQFGTNGERDTVMHTRFFREREVRDELLRHLRRVPVTPTT